MGGSVNALLERTESVLSVNKWKRLRTNKTREKGGGTASAMAKEVNG